MMVESGIGRVPIVEPKTRRLVGLLARQDLLKARNTQRRSETGRTRYFRQRSEEHTSELQSLMRISYAVFCLKKKTTRQKSHDHNNTTFYVYIRAHEREN